MNPFIPNSPNARQQQSCNHMELEEYRNISINKFSTNDQISFQAHFPLLATKNLTSNKVLPPLDHIGITTSFHPKPIKATNGIKLSKEFKQQIYQQTSQVNRDLISIDCKDKVFKKIEKKLLEKMLENAKNERIRNDSNYISTMMKMRSDLGFTSMSHTSISSSLEQPTNSHMISLESNKSNSIQLTTHRKTKPYNRMTLLKSLLE